MIRRSTRTVLGQGYAEEEDPSPMETVANISDVMLVLAVALMLALITRMGVDFTAFRLNEADLQEIDSEQIQEGDTTSQGGGDSDYREVGKVYRNSDGDMFMLES